MLCEDPKDEETVDPDSIIPSNCSIENVRNMSQNMTWKEVNDEISPLPGVVCLVLKTGNSKKRIYFASKYCVPCYQCDLIMIKTTFSMNISWISKGQTS